MVEEICATCGRTISLATTSATLDGCPFCRAVGPATRSCPDDELREMRAALADAAVQERFEVGEVLGAGATGVVFRATRRAGGAVALKVLRQTASRLDQERFAREAALLADLAHPNVVGVHAVGRAGALTWMAIELVEGGTLRDRLNTPPPLTLPEVIGVAQSVLAGLAACHARGVVHRDLKPENVLFSTTGHVKVSDLGIAKPQTGADVTRTGALVGTPRYMAPEQIQGQSAEPAADVYSVGVLLYEMVAGHPPFTSERFYDLLRMHVEAEPPPLAEAAPGVPRAIAAVVHRALAKQPRERPSTAQFAADLQAALSVCNSGEFPRLVKRPEGWDTDGKGTGPFPSGPAVTQRIGDAPRRPRALIALVALVGLLGAAALGWSLSSRSAPATAAAGMKATKASSKRSDDVNAVAFTPDGRLLTACDDGQIHLWDFAKGTPVQSFPGLARDVDALAIAPDGSWFAAAGEEGWVRAWRAGGDPLFAVDANAVVVAMDRSPDGALIALAAKDPLLRLLDVRAQKMLEPIPVPHEELRLVAFLPDGRLATSGRVGGVRIWDLARRAETRAIGTPDDRGRALAIGRDGRLLAFGESADAFIHDLTDPRRPPLRIRAAATELIGLTFRNDSNHLVAVSREGAVRLFDAATGEKLWLTSYTGRRVHGAVYTPDQRQILVCGVGGTQVFDAEKGTPLKLLR